MAGNMFINTTGLEIEKSIPALVGIDFSGVRGKSPDFNIGEVVSNIADKSKAITSKQNFLNLKSQLDKVEAEYNQKYLADPNAFATEENRNVIVSAYNDLVEQKKSLLASAKSTMGADQYNQLSDYFKRTTYDSLKETQYKINVGHIKNTTDNVILESSNILETLTTISDPQLRDERVGDALDLMGSLKDIGVDPKQMQLEYVVNAQKRLTDFEVNTNIINSVDERFWLRDKNGNVVRDSNGNPYMDNAKKNTALMALQHTFLGDKQITAAAKEVSKKIGVDLETAKAYIKNNREGDWLKIAQNARSQFATEDSAIQAKLIAEERKIVESGYDNLNKVKGSAFGDWKEMGAYAFGQPVTDNQLNDPNVMRVISDNTYNNVDEVVKDNRYIRTIDKNTVDSLKQLQSNNDYNSLSEQIKTMTNFDGSTGVDSMSEMKIQQLSDELNLKPNTVAALSGREAQVSSEEAVKTLTANKTLGTINTVLIPRTKYLKESNIDPVLNAGAMQLAMKEILLSNDFAPFRNVEIVDEFNKERILTGIFKEAETRPELKESLDKIFKKAKILDGGSKKIAYNFNTSTGSLAETAYRSGVSAEAMKRADKYEKSGALPTIMTHTQVGMNKTNLPYGAAYTKLALLKDGTYDMVDINSMDWDNKEFAHAATPYVLKGLQEGKMDPMNVSPKIFTIPEVEEYYKQLLNNSQK